MLKRTAHKLLWLAAGLICIVIGILGFLLPILPGFIFIILAIVSFMRCSPRFDKWMHCQPWFIRMKDRYHQRKKQ